MTVRRARTIGRLSVVCAIAAAGVGLSGCGSGSGKSTVTTVGSGPPLTASRTQASTTETSTTETGTTKAPVSTTSTTVATSRPTTGVTPPVTKGAIPAAVLRRVRQVCDVAPPAVAQGTEQSGGSAATKQTLEALLPRTEALQQGISVIVAKAASDQVVGLALSPLLEAVNRLQSDLQNALAAKGSPSMSEVQIAAQQVNLTAQQMGLPECRLDAQ
jgi:hypothetical protein